MLLRYFYDNKLAQASYFVGCQQTGEAIVVDPAREIQPYIDTAELEEMHIIGTTETHIHADFVSGSRELAERVGATLYLSDCGDADWKYDFANQYAHNLVQDGDSFMVGNLRFEVMHTPGHTPEHISLLLTDTIAADRPMGIFTGDFVFVGDIGRPDLLEKAAKIANTAEIGARQMFHSLQRFCQLPDYLQVWPGHGAGSACGKELGAVPTSTAGYEKLFNWAFNVAGEEEFVHKLLADQPEPPRYFAMMKRVNKEGPAVLHNLKPCGPPTGPPSGPLSRQLPRELPFDTLVSLLEDDRPVVDTRPPDQFARSHIPGTLNIPLESSFTTWAGWLLDYDQPYFLIGDQQNLSEAVRYLSSIGLDNCAGFFESSIILNWLAAGFSSASYQVLQPHQVAVQLSENDSILIDVRNQSEWNEGHIPGAQHIMLGYLAQQATVIPKDKHIIVQCRIGMRSAIAASILRTQGFEAVSNLAGGIVDWQNSGLPITNGL